MILSEQVQMLLDSPWGRRLPYLICSLLALMLLFSIIQITQLFVIRDKSQPQFVTSPLPTTRIANIADWHLFGIYHPKVIDAKKLPATTLNLKLIGLYLANPEKYSHAIIAIPGEPEKLYKINDILPGNVKVYKILQDRIVLEHNNRLETLTLPTEKLDMSGAPEALNFGNQ